MKSVKLMIVGFGVIGKSVVQSINEKNKTLRKQGLHLQVNAICDIKGSLFSEEGLNINHVLDSKFEKNKSFVKKNAKQLLDDSDFDILVELTPGDITTGQPGLSHIKAALRNGVNVVTSNKSPLAVAYQDLIELAQDNNVQLLFEATVGGAIPLLGLKHGGLAGNKVSNVVGILNGTTNYVLTKMDKEGMPLDLAVREAQELGYAETDPTYDIDGIDVAAKVVILANHFLGINAKFSDVDVTGIRKITPEALELARQKGYTIKLIGDARNLEVGPRLIPIDHPLNVSDNLNAALLETDLAGEVTLIGYGAGGKETSSAILADILRIAEKI